MTSPRSSASPTKATTDIHDLLERAGYLEDAGRLDCDPDLQQAISDPEFLAWLAAGAPGSGTTTEHVTLTRKGLQATQQDPTT